MSFFLTLGVGLNTTTNYLLNKCENEFVTIAVFDYENRDASNDSVLAEKSVASALENENVIVSERYSDAVVTIKGYRSNFGALPMKSFAVLRICNVSMNVHGAYNATVAESYYSYSGDSAIIITMTDETGRFVPEYNKSYIVHGSFSVGSTSLQHLDLISIPKEIADDAEVDPSIPYAVPYEEGDDISEYVAVANCYARYNSTASCTVTGNLDAVPSFHQQTCYITSGRSFTQDEYYDNSPVCILSSDIAAFTGLQIGDKIDFTVYNDIDTLVRATNDKNISYEIIGLTNIDKSIGPQVYIPRSPDSTLTYANLTELGHAIIKNGSDSEFIVDVNDKLPLGVSVTIYDQGYKAVRENLLSISSTSLTVSALSCVACLAVLLLFAYQFIYKQRESLKTMLLVGTSVAKTSSYIILSSTLLVLAASIIGALVGVVLCGKGTEIIYTFIAKASYITNFYTSSNLGIAKEFSLTAPAPILTAILCILFLIVVAALLCLAFARNILIPKKNKSLNKRVKISEKNMVTIKSKSALKYSLLSIIRTPSRSLIVPVVSAATVIFLCILAFLSESYTEKLIKSKEGYTFDVAYSSYDGKSTTGILLEYDKLKKVYNSGYGENFLFSLYDKYTYGGISAYSDGSEGKIIPFVMPTNEFLYETLMDRVRTGPSVYYINKPEASIELKHYTSEKFDFSEGYDIEMFGNSYDENVCIVPDTMLQRLNLQYGDILNLRIGYDMVDTDYKIVGSFIKGSQKENIYCPLSGRFAISSFAMTDEERDSEEGRIGREIKSFFLYTELHGGNKNADGIDFMQLCATFPRSVTFDVGYDWYGYNVTVDYFGTIDFDSTSFTVPIDEIEDFKTFLYENGISAVRKIKAERSYVVIEDREYASSIGSLEKYVKYINILYPILYIITAAEGFIVSYLLINNRKNELTVMRGIGASSKRVFFTFFAEQAILCIFGTLTGAALCGVAGYFANTSLINIGAFILCYFLGCLISVSAINKSDVLTLMSNNDE